jgi:hypothetical protein
MAKYAYLKLVWATTFIQCCWMQVHERKEFRRLKIDTNKLSIKPGGDSRTNHLEKRGNNMIQ